MNTILNEIALHPYLPWIAVAIVCGVLEIVLPSFFFIFASGAALLTAAIALRVNLALQLTSFGALLILSLLLIRPRFATRLQSKQNLPSRSDAMIGKAGKVTEAIDPIAATGRVLIEGQDWSAKSLKKIAVGKTISVESTDGIMLVVKEI